MGVDGTLAKESSVFIKRLAGTLAEKWDKSLSEVTGWVRARVQFAAIRATNACLRDTRVKFRCLGFEDGAGIRAAMS